MNVFQKIVFLFLFLLSGTLYFVKSKAVARSASSVDASDTIPIKKVHPVTKSTPSKISPKVLLNQKRNAYLNNFIRTIIQKEHYSPKKIDDSLSKHLFWWYLNILDYEKSIFLQEDINLLKKYEYLLDNEILQNKFSFVYEVGRLYNKRIAYLNNYYVSVLKKPFDYSVSDSIVFDENKFTYAKNLSELCRKWDKKLKFMVLQRYYDNMELRNKKTVFDTITKQRIVKDTADTSFIVKADSTLEREARERVMKITKKLFVRYKKKFNTQEKIDAYLNMFCTYMDPHTNYFPPLDKRSFDESMSKKFYGIGARLKEEDGVGMKIVEVITGGAAWKSGKIQQGDVIIKVAEENKEYQDLVGYDIEEAVKMIRGDKDSKVSLGIKKSSGSIIYVTVERREVKQEESLARSVVINDNGKRIGYLYLPDFYSDFRDRQGSQSSVDVAVELGKLKQENVDGVIFDLRNNGGGSLNDVVQIAGYFIFKGPIVQIKEKGGRIRILPDNFGWVWYSGPLIVMVNEFSASAAEIFAAAMQDYKRGIVVGTTTYGKGTVQQEVELKQPTYLKNAEPLGGLKLTVQKFYRINGGTTQLKGVEPDIVLPSRYEYAKLREQDNKNYLGWDEIPKADYKEWNFKSYEPATIIADANKRLDTSKIFRFINTSAKWLAEQREKTRSLNLTRYKSEEKEINKMNDTMDKIFKIQDKDTLLLEPVKIYETPPTDTAKASNPEEKDKFKIKQESYNEWLKYVKKDIYLKETVKIMKDIILGGNN